MLETADITDGCLFKSHVRVNHLGTLARDLRWLRVLPEDSGLSVPTHFSSIPSLIPHSVLLLSPMAPLFHPHSLIFYTLPNFKSSFLRDACSNSHLDVQVQL